jgi:N-lysine methyltransferase SETD6
MSNMQTHPDIFVPGDIATHYSVHQFHITGSRILSRSFEIEQSDEEDLIESTTNPVPDDASIIAKEDQSDQEEDHTEIAMVPIADMLNARFGCENVGSRRPLR